MSQDSTSSVPKQQLGFFPLPIIAFILFATLALALPVTGVAHAEGLGTWTATTDFPLSNVGTSCAAYGGYMYCIGGNLTYYAVISSSGIGTWSSTTSYPVGTQTSVPPVCAASAGYIYCVGGDDGTPLSLRNSVYYAPVSSSGVGTWIQTTNTTGTSNGQSCFISGNYLYCVGGNYGIGVMTTKNVVYAPISSTGVGLWNTTTGYPYDVTGTSCAVSGGYVYCAGGEFYHGGYYDTNATYYAPVSQSGGIGSWTATTTYPGTTDPGTCVSSTGYMYCIDGFDWSSGQSTDAVYYAPLSSAGIGAWQPTATYPSDAGYPHGSGCMVSSAYIYCLGGGGSGTPAYFVEVVSVTTTSSSSSSSLSVSTTSTSSSSSLTLSTVSSTTSTTSQTSESSSAISTSTTTSSGISSSSSATFSESISSSTTSSAASLSQASSTSLSAAYTTQVAVVAGVILLLAIVATRRAKAGPYRQPTA